MIEQLQFIVRTADGSSIPSSWAYRIYGWMMQQLPSETAAWLHEQGVHPLSQYLAYDSLQQATVWTSTFLDQTLAEQVKPLLNDRTVLELHGTPLYLEPLYSNTLEGGMQLLLAARNAPVRRAKLRFCTPCAFKQSGRYAIYPQESLLLQSLVLHWNAAFPDCPLDDPDALDALLRGTQIVEYNLHTPAYYLKGTRIPGFVGSAVVDAHLSLPLLEVWNALLAFAPYGGIGIKTALGMGGAEVMTLTEKEH